MGRQAADFDPFSPSTWPTRIRWSVLLILSVAGVSGLEAVHIPAALLLGPMFAAIIIATTGAAVRTPPFIFLAAQGMVGTMMASSLHPKLLQEVAADWPIFTAGTVSTLVAASLLGWLMARSKALPGTTAIWGSSPGAATIMTIMSESYGADMRLVAFMQYLRVIACALVATIVAGSMGTSAHSDAMQWLPDMALWQHSILSIGLALAGAAVGGYFKIPGGALLIPMAIGMVAQLTGMTTLVLPMPVLAISYAVIGWGIGMRFSPSVVKYAARVFPRVALSIIILIGICAGFAALLVIFAGVDPLTAFLATSPGGADSVAIIAASTKVDIAFVLSMQVARFLLVLLVGPVSARFLSRGQGPLKKQES